MFIEISRVRTNRTRNARGDGPRVYDVNHQQRLRTAHPRDCDYRAHERYSTERTATTAVPLPKTAVVAFVSPTWASLADTDLVDAAPAFAVDHFPPGGATHSCAKALLAGTLNFAVTAGVMHGSKPFSPKVLRCTLRPRPGGGRSASRNPETYHRFELSASPRRTNIAPTRNARRHGRGACRPLCRRRHLTAI